MSGGTSTGLMAMFETSWLSFRKSVRAPGCADDAAATSRAARSFDGRELLVRRVAQSARGVVEDDLLVGVFLAVALDLARLLEVEHGRRSEHDDQQDRYPVLSDVAEHQRLRTRKTIRSTMMP